MGIKLSLMLFISLGWNSGWADPWQTDNQKAYALYQKKDYQKAQTLFKDKFWRASSHYKNHDYVKAIEGFKTIHTSDGFYNLGNALALGGDLKQAIHAYEKALKLAPKDKDIKYNLELCKKLLQKQEQKEPLFLMLWNKTPSKKIFEHFSCRSEGYYEQYSLSHLSNWLRLFYYQMISRFFQ
jgi:tetratricopeptide (TPR) repeat protein